VEFRKLLPAGGRHRSGTCGRGRSTRRTDPGPGSVCPVQQSGELPAERSIEEISQPWNRRPAVLSADLQENSDVCRRGALSDHCAEWTLAADVPVWTCVRQDVYKRQSGEFATLPAVT